MELALDENNINNNPIYSNDDPLLIELFSKLYQSFNQEEIIVPSNKNSIREIKKKLFSNFKITKKDEPTIVNLLQDKVSKLSNFNPDIINHFQNLYHKLLHKRTLTKRWEILYLLNNLSKIPKIYKQLDYPENDLLQKKIIDINCNISGNDIIDNENKFLNYKTKSNNNIELDPALENDINNENSPIIIDTKKSQLNITEKDIVTDLLFVLVGINGKYIKYNSAKESFILDENIPWDEKLYDIVYSISEVGWLYYKINNYISWYKESNIRSLYIQSLIFAIQNELDEYYKLISLFKKINNNDLSGNINHIPLNNSINETSKYQKKLNLKNLFMGVLSYKEKLKWLLICCETVQTLKGSSVLSQIYSYVKYLGNYKYLNNVLNEVSKPFISFILNWIIYGEIRDPFNEFFVEIIDDIKDDDIWQKKYKLIGNNIPNFVKREPIVKIFEIGKCIHFIRKYCNEKYSLNNLKQVIQYIIQKYSEKSKEEENNNISQIIDKENNEKNIKMEEESSTTEENSINDKPNNNYSKIKYISEFDYGIDKDKIIFEINSYKSLLNFISLIFSISSSDMEGKDIKILNISFLEEIFQNIDIAHTLINKELIRIFFQKFKLIENLESLNKYLLLGQGDMIQSLMESLYPELKKPAGSIYKYVLQSILESSINSTNARFNDKECLNKLNIKLLNPLPGDTGWDIFCLEYNLPLPLTVIINKKNILDYQKMFIFLLKIKRIEYSQEHQEWRKIMTYSHNSRINKNYDFFRKKIKTSLQFNQQIIHFIISLHNYLTLEVLETQYKKLLKKLKILNNLDELIIAHDEFINSIKQKCFLDNNNNNNIIIYKKIISIFDIILRFRTAHDVLIATLLQKFQEDEEEKSLDEEENEEDENYINFNKRIDESLKQITFLFEEFKNKIIELINSMKEIGKDLEYLAMKIDFNYYYSLIEKEKEEKQQQLVYENLIKEEKRLRFEKLKERENLYKDIHGEVTESKEMNEENNINYISNNDDINNQNMNNYNINEMNNYNDYNNINNYNDNNNIENDNYDDKDYNINNINQSEGNNNYNFNYNYNNNSYNNKMENNNNYYYNKYNIEDYEDDKKYSGDEGMEEDENNDQ